MQKHFSCPQGHQWAVPVDGKRALAVDTISCPECGAAAETLRPGESAVATPGGGIPRDEARTLPPLEATAPGGEEQAESRISVACPGCGKKLRVKASLAGKKARCPGCQGAVPVPLDAVTQGPEARTLAPRDSGVRTTGQFKSGANVSPGQAAASSASFEFLAPPQAADELGRLGHYRVLKVLGEGGMGVVFRAEDTKLQRPVALKAMQPSMASSGSAKERFLREARAAAQIKHDHIVAIYQVDEDRGSPYLAMEFLEGEPLDVRLKRENIPPLHETVRIAREIAEGLSAAHDRGMVHRDIKPANVWLETRAEGGGRKAEEKRRDDGSSSDLRPPSSAFRVKILDFGLARAVQEETHLTQQGAIVGTPAYMAPEQASASEPDHRADLFSLGCILYEMTTGERPFRGRDTMSILMALASHEPPAPGDVNPEVPPELSKLTMQLLAKEPNGRPESAHEVARTLRAMERQLEGDDSSDTTFAAGPKKYRATAAAGAGNRKWIIAATIVLALGALVAAGVYLFRVSTPEGDFFVEVQDDDVALALDKQGGLTLIGGNGKKYSILARKTTKLPAGDYDVVIADANGLEISGQTVTIRAKDSPASVKVWFRKMDVVETKQHPTLPSVVGLEEVRRISVPSLVHSFAVFPDKPVVLCGDKAGMLRLWDFEKGKEIDAWSAHKEPKALTCVRLSPTDGSRAATCSQGGIVQLWDIARKEPVQMMPDPPDSAIDSVGFSPDGKHLVCGGNDLWVFDAHTCKTVASFAREKYGYTKYGPKAKNKRGFGDPVFASDRLILWCGNSSPVTLFDWQEKKHVLHAQWEDQCFHVAVSRDGRRALSGHSGKPGKEEYDYDAGSAVRLWDLHDLAKPPKVLGEHSKAVRALAFSPDGRLGVTGSQDGTMQLWDLERTKQLQQVVVNGVDTGGNRFVQWLDFSADGKHVIASTSTVVKVFRLTGSSDGATQTEPSEPVGEVRRIPVPATIQSMAVVPNSTLVLCGDAEGKLRLWDHDTGLEKKSWQAHQGPVKAVSVSPADGNQALSCGLDGTLRLWDIAKGQEIRKLLDVPGHFLESVDFTNDGRHALVASDGDKSKHPFAAWVIDVQTGKQVDHHESQRGFRGAAFAGDHQAFFCIAEKPTLRDWKAGKSLFEFRPEDECFLAAASQDGRLALSSQALRIKGVFDLARSFNICVWDLKDRTKAPARLKGHTSWVTALAFSANANHALSAGRDGTIRLWDLKTAQERHCFDAASNSPKITIVSAAFSADERFALAATNNNLLQVWRLPGPGSTAQKTIVKTKEVPAEPVGEVRRYPHPGPVTALCFTRDGKFALSGDGAGLIRIWNLATSKEEASWQGGADKPINDLSISPIDDNLAMSSGEDGTLRLWDIAKRTEIRKLVQAEGARLAPAMFSPDGTLAYTRSLSAGSEEVRCKTWVVDIQSGKVLQSFQTTPAVRGGAFVGNDRLFYLLNNKPLLVDWKTQKTIFEFNSDDVCRMAAVAPSGRLALSGMLKSGLVHLWDLVDHTKAPLLLQGHQAPAQSLAFAPDEQRALSGAEDGTMRLWDVRTGKEIHNFTVVGKDAAKAKRPPSWKHVGIVAFSPDGRYALSGSGNNLMQLWRLPDSETPAPPIAKEKQPIEPPPPNVFDKLRRADIPKEQLDLVGHDGGATGLPELVAIFGDGRLSHWNGVTALAFSADGKSLISSGNDGTLRVWDPDTGRQKQRLPEKGWPGYLHGLTVSPDGKTVVTRNGQPVTPKSPDPARYLGPLLQWDLATGKQKVLVPEASTPAFSQDGRLLAWGTRTHAELAVRADLEIGKLPRSLKTGGPVNVVAFNADGSLLATATLDGMIRIWDTATGAEKKALTGHKGVVASLAFRGASNELVSLGEDKSLRVWDALSGDTLRAFPGIAAAEMQVSPDGARLALSGKVGALWDLDAGKEIAALRPPHYSVRALAFSPDGKRVACDYGTKIALFDAATGELVLAPAGHPHGGQGIATLAIHPEGKLLASAEASSIVYLWDVTSRKIEKSLSGHKAQVDSLAFSPDGLLLAVGGSDVKVTKKAAAKGKMGAPSVVVFDLSSGKERWRGPGAFKSVVFSPDSKMAAALGDAGVLLVWDAASGKELTRQQLAEVGGAVAFSMDGGQLAAGNQIFEVGTWKETHKLKATAQIFSPDLALMGAVNKTDDLEILETASGKRRRVVKHYHTVFSPHGSLVAAGTGMTKLAVWDLNAAATAGPMRAGALGPGTGTLGALAFSPEGRHLLTVNPNGTIYVLRLANPDGTLTSHVPMVLSDLMPP